MQKIYYVSAWLAEMLVLFVFSWNVAEGAGSRIAGSCDNAASGFCN